MSSGPPDRTGTDGDRDADGSETRVLHIDQLHLHANEIDSLARLAKTDPELARIIVDQKDAFDKREHGSYRFGMLVSGSLVLGIIACLTYAFVKLGIVLSILLIFCLIAAGLFVRVLLTGEWSDTSFVGHMIKGIIHALGGKSRE